MRTYTVKASDKIKITGISYGDIGYNDLTPVIPIPGTNMLWLVKTSKSRKTYIELNSYSKNFTIGSKFNDVQTWYRKRKGIMRIYKVTFVVQGYGRVYDGLKRMYVKDYTIEEL